METNCKSMTSKFDHDKILLKYDNLAYYIANRLLKSSLQPILEYIQIAQDWSNGNLCYLYKEFTIEIDLRSFSNDFILYVTIYNNKTPIATYIDQLNLNKIQHLDLIATYITKVEKAYEYSETQLHELLTKMGSNTCYEDTILNEYNL